MKDYNDFTYDNKRFAGLPQFVDHLHQIGMKYVTMFDCGISSGETPGTYSPFDEGLALDIFIKNSSGKPFEGMIILFVFLEILINLIFYLRQSMEQKFYRLARLHKS